MLEPLIRVEERYPKFVGVVTLLLSLPVFVFSLAYRNPKSDFKIGILPLNVAGLVFGALCLPFVLYGVSKLREPQPYSLLKDLKENVRIGSISLNGKSEVPYSIRQIFLAGILFILFPFAFGSVNLLNYDIMSKSTGHRSVKGGIVATYPDGSADVRYWDGKETRVSRVADGKGLSGGVMVFVPLENPSAPTIMSHQEYGRTIESWSSFLLFIGFMSVILCLVVSAMWVTSNSRQPD